MQRCKKRPHKGRRGMGKGDLPLAGWFTIAADKKSECPCGHSDCHVKSIFPFRCSRAASPGRDPAQGHDPKTTNTSPG